MRIAILGAGFCGTAAAWHLALRGDAEVVVFDPAGIGGGASGVAAGLLHPYVGAHSKLNWRGIEGMEATLQLINSAEKALNAPVASHNGMLRLAITEQQSKDYRQCADRSSGDVTWKTAKECQKAVPGLEPHPGIFVHSAVTVDCRRYLQGLWQDCFAHGVKLEHKAIATLSEVQHFDRIIVAMGSATKNLPELAHLPITLTKGQILEIAWPQDLPPLPYPLNSQAYLLMNSNGATCIAGATFEKQFDNSLPDLEKAKQEIMPKLLAYFPSLGKAEIMDCRSGIRAGMPNRRPLIAKITEKCWVFTGMGSKGLLYHALMAKELVDDIAMC
jgi:glycine/D-amino acid oxidase-like deaminating enzyme